MHEAKLIEILFPHLVGMSIERVDEDGDQVLVWARSLGAQAVCPDCATASAAVHSRYQRRLDDLPVGGRPLSILLAVRRFFCANVGCARRTFAEQFGDVAGRRRRRTGGLLGMLTVLAVAVGGRAGARVAARMAIAVSRTTLLGLVRALPEPEVVAPRVLGIDDFALRKGSVYASVRKPGVQAN